MKLELSAINLRLATVLLLSIATVISPSWPAVFALLSVVAYDGLCQGFKHFAEKDQRLDVEARRDAKKAALVMDELVKRLQHLEEWQSAVKMNQHRGPSWQQMMNGGA